MYLYRHDRGEGIKGYSLPFRQLEFTNAMEAELFDSKEKVKIAFKDAEIYEDEMDDSYQNLQYIGSNKNISNRVWISTVERCCLVNALYEIIGVGDSYEELTASMLSSNKLKEYYRGGSYANATWSLRIRQYNKNKTNIHNMNERELVKTHLSLVFRKLGGRVSLRNPDCPFFLMVGLSEHDYFTKQLVMVQKLAEGVSTSVLSPNTRLVRTTTPLDTISSYLLCNLGKVVKSMSSHCRILDPFAGSCTTLLAASLITASNCQTVGIDIQMPSNRQIEQEFIDQNCTPPVALIHGDCLSMEVREQARNAINQTSFDVIITDPPYGIRERIVSSFENPLIELISVIRQDLLNGTPLLNPQGGRLVAFIPQVSGDELCLPNQKVLNEARLKQVILQKQYMSRDFSRWLVVYTSSDFAANQ